MRVLAEKTIDEVLNGSIEGASYEDRLKALAKWNAYSDEDREWFEHDTYAEKWEAKDLVEYILDESYSGLDWDIKWRHMTEDEKRELAIKEGWKGWQ